MEIMVFFILHICIMYLIKGIQVLSKWGCVNFTKSPASIVDFWHIPLQMYVGIVRPQQISYVQFQTENIFLSE